jgi:hypothetical protein
MIPFVNIQDLQHKDLLLMLLDARSRHPPHTFARTELLLAPYGKVDVQSLDRMPLLKIQIDNARQYGTVQTFASEQKAMDFEDEGRGVRPVKGLQIIYLQDLLLGFLLNVTKLILHDKIESIDFDRSPAAPAPLRGCTTKSRPGSLKWQSCNLFGLGRVSSSIESYLWYPPSASDPMTWSGICGRTRDISRIDIA